MIMKYQKSQKQKQQRRIAGSSVLSSSLNTLSVFPLLLLLLLFSSVCIQPTLANNDTDVSPPIPALISSDCPELWQDFCSRESDRYCYLDDTTATPKCGTCLPGFIEWNGVRCLNQKQVGIVQFLEEYAPQYLQPVSMEERYRILTEVIAYIENHQNQNPPPSYELGLNEYSADTEEDTRQRLGFNPNITVPPEEDILEPPMVQSAGVAETYPSSMDWTELNAVTAVKDQGRCGCCWAVTVAGAIEGAVAVATGYLQSLSFQQLISCDDENLGCNGGNLVYAIKYAVKTNGAGGISRLMDYEYTDYDGSTSEQCEIQGRDLAVVVNSGEYVVDYFDNSSFEERMEKMKIAVARQPVAIVIRSNCRTITNYKSGVITDDEACACNDAYCADHAVLLVGYNDDAPIPYWKIKNSWSERWGENGYFRIAQTKKGNYGLFGVLVHGVIPTMAYNITGQLAEEPQPSDDDDLEWWIIVCIIVGGMLCCCCIFGAIFGRSKK